MGEDDQLGPEDITKGKAANMITKLKHGAHRRFLGLEVEKRKRTRIILAEQKKQARLLGDAIPVGPVLPLDQSSSSGFMCQDNVTPMSPPWKVGRKRQAQSLDGKLPHGPRGGGPGALSLFVKGTTREHRS